MNSLQTRARIRWIDLIRAGAILCVLLCHSIESIYPLNANQIRDVGLISSIFSFICLAIGRLGVPFFLMISGYLLLDREYDNDHCLRFWKTNWLHLFLCTQIWIVIYEIFMCCMDYQDFSLSLLIQRAFFLTKSNMSHLWYMPMYLGMYILLPFVSNSLKHVNVSLLLFPVCIYMICSFGQTFVNLLLKMKDLPTISVQFSTGFSGGAYGIYLIFGYLLKKDVFKKIPGWLLGVGTAVFFSLTVLLLLCYFSTGKTYNLWYDNLLLMLCSVCIFELVSRIQYIPCYRIIRHLSCYSFAIYLIHNIFRFPLRTYLTTLSISRSIKVFILTLATAIISYVSVYLLNKIPKIGKFLLYTK